MTRTFVVAGLAGSAVVASMWAARAQDAVAPPPATEQQQQAQAAPPPAAQACNGLVGCFFGGSSAQPAAAPPPPQAAAGQQPPVEAQPVVDEPKAAAKPKPRPKPVHAVTIAAGATEVGRLKGLVSAMPRGKVKIVTTAATEPSADTDFSVTTSLDDHGGEKAKLFTEQLHIVAGGTVQTLADLKDKVVSFGLEKSPGQAAARKAFDALNIPVKEAPLDLDNALDGLATGDIAAVVVLAPQPVERFTKLSASGLHLVSWPQDGALPAGAVAATIDASRYPSFSKADAPVRAVGVDAILRISAKGSREPASRSFLSALSQHSAALSRRGFDLLKADLETRNGRRVASDEAR